MTSTADIRLRALEPEDLELMYRIENDARFWRHGTTTVPYSRYALREYLANSHNDIFADGQVRLVIERVATTEVATTEGTTEITPIGFADLVNFDAIHLRAEIGLLILPEYQGQHCGRATLQHLCDYARQLHLHQIYAIIATTNEPAMQLFAHSAFEASTPLHDWLRTDEGFADAIVWQLYLSAA